MGRKVLYSSAAEPDWEDPLEFRNLTTLLNSGSSWKRLDALDILRKSYGELALLAARLCLTDSNSEVRRLSADIIGESGSARDIYRLILVSKDRSWKVRSSVAEALGLIGGAQASKAISEMFLADRHFVVRRDAASALISVNKGAEGILRGRIAREKNRIVKIAIYANLYALGDSRALAPVLTELQASNVMLRHNAINMLSNLTIKQDDIDLVRSRLDQLIETEKEPGIREDALDLRRII